jgi:hypothetical protein
MSYRIEQNFEYAGDDYWRWWAWIECDDTELDNIKEVIWILHPSFEPTQVIASEKSDKFRLETAGWGTFLLRATVSLKDGTKLPLKHNLRLEYPAFTKTPHGSRSMVAPAPQKSRPPIVYLSYSTRDVRAASKLRAGLVAEGLQVHDQTELKAGDPLSEVVRRMMEKSDAVLVLAGDDVISPFVNADIKAAVASSKPTLVLRSPDASSVQLSDDVHALTVNINDVDPGMVASQLWNLKAN